MGSLLWGAFSIFQMSRYLNNKGYTFIQRHFNFFGPFKYLHETLDEYGKPGIWFISFLCSILVGALTIIVGVTTNA